MRRTVVDPRFASVLAGLLIENGMSQRQVADRAHVSRSYLCEIINGEKMPSEDVAAALDEALGAGGRLVNVVALAGASEDLDQLAAVAANPRQVGNATIESLARVLHAQRYLDDTIGSAALVGPVEQQLDTVTMLVNGLSGPGRADLLYVTAQWAQFAGWLNVSVGRWESARAWFGRAMEWATEHGDRDLTATIISYQAHLCWLTCRWPSALGLAHAALRDPKVYPGQRAYDAYAAARSHAVLGDLAAAERMLAMGDSLSEEVCSWTAELPPWQYYRHPWLWSLERGLVWLYVTRHDPRCAPVAVAELTTGIEKLPEEMRGADWVGEYLIHLATALIGVRNIAEARGVLDQARAIAESTRSRRVLRMVRGRERRLQYIA